MSKRRMLIPAIWIGVLVLFSIPSSQAQHDPNDLGIADTLYVEIFDCDHGYEAEPGSFDSVRVAIYVTHDSNTFWWESEGKWVQDSIRAFQLPLVFWHQPYGCADSVILPYWDEWNNRSTNPYDPKMNRSIFRDLVDEHTGDTVYNRMFWLGSHFQGLEWSTYMDIESHSSDGDSGGVFLNPMCLFPSSRAWWEGSRVLLATLTFHVYMSGACDTTEIGIDSILWPPQNRLAFFRPDISSYVPRHFLPVKDTICIVNCGDVNGDGIVDVGDVIYLIGYLYIGASPPNPLCIGDVNCDDVVDGGDVVYLINYLFLGTSAPCTACCSQ